MKTSKKNIVVKIVADAPEFVPQYKTAGAAGADIVANIPANEAGHRFVNVMPNQVEIIDAGFSMAIPEGYEVQIRPRSGLATRGLQVTNSPGTIDEDFRGRVKIILNNTSKNIITLNHLDRIAQMVIAPVYRASWLHVENLDETERGSGGFGSTGTK